jgi:hypothetical protein
MCRSAQDLRLQLTLYHIRILKSWTASMANTFNPNTWETAGRRIRNWISYTASVSPTWAIKRPCLKHTNNHPSNKSKKLFKMYHGPLSLALQYQQCQETSHIACCHPFGIPLLKALTCKSYSIYWGPCLLGLVQEGLSNFQSFLGVKMRIHSKPAHHFKDLIGQLRSHKRDRDLFSLSIGHHSKSQNSQLSICHSGRLDGSTQSIAVICTQLSHLSRATISKSPAFSILHTATQLILI